MTEVYTGVKFTALFEGVHFDYDNERKAIVEELVRLREKNLLDRNNGNVSVNVQDGMIITPTGKNMAQIDERDLILVTDVDENKNVVSVIGRTQPSSETMMHWLIYKNFPKIKAVVHFHNKELLEHHELFVETSKAYPYGTAEMAHSILAPLKKNKFIIIKNHGALAIGKDLKTCDNLVNKALKLVKS